MISGKPNQQTSSQVDPNMSDGRVPNSLLAPIRPQRMLYQNELGGSNLTADLVPFPEHRNMLVLSSQSLVPGLFPSSFKTGTTLPSPADPFLQTGPMTPSFGFPPNDGSQSGWPAPLQTTFPDEHVVLLF